MLNHTGVYSSLGKVIINLALPVPALPKDATPGEKLLHYRINKGLSHKDVANYLGYKKSFGIVDLEKGFNAIHYKDAVKIAELLEIDPEELLDDYTEFCKPGYGICITRIREAYGLSQNEFAKIIGVTRSRESCWESECTDYHPSRKNFEKIKELGINIGFDIKRLIENPEEYRDEYTIFSEKDWGKKIRQIRLAHGLLYEDYAKLIGCDEQTLEHWEIGITRPLRKYFSNIKKTAIACGIDLEKLNDDPEYFGSDYQRFIAENCDRKIKSIRMAYGITTYALGDLIGCTGEAISRWENKKCVPELKCFKVIERLARDKGISIDQLNKEPDLVQDDYLEFCQNGYSKIIRGFRKQCGLLQAELAKELNVSASTMRNWEQARFIPSRDNYNALKQYALERGVSINDS